MRLFLFGIISILLVGCAPYLFDREGNEYVLSIEKHKVSLITVSNDFHYSHRIIIDGEAFDVYSNKNKDRSIMVLDKFGWYDSKGSAKDATKGVNDKVIHISDDNLQITQITRTNMSLDTISKLMIASEPDVEDKWITLFAIYTEYLPHNFQFDSWESVPTVEKDSFLAGFHGRASESVEFNLNDF